MGTGRDMLFYVYGWMDGSELWDLGVMVYMGEKNRGSRILF